jgi:hypothetical protein
LSKYKKMGKKAPFSKNTRRGHAKDKTRDEGMY